MLRRAFIKTVGVIALAATTAGMAVAEGHSSKMDIVETAAAAGAFNTLLAAADAAGLVGALKGEGPFTVFAPTDEAFAALPAGTVESLLEPANKDQLIAILTYHVVPAKIMSGDIAGKKAKVLTLQGERLSVNARNGVRVDKAKVVNADIAASNGVIHVIDTVLMPAS